jgi:hypothetical protein
VEYIDHDLARFWKSPTGSRSLDELIVVLYRGDGVEVIARDATSTKIRFGGREGWVRGVLKTTANAVLGSPDRKWSPAATMLFSQPPTAEKWKALCVNKATAIEKDYLDVLRPIYGAVSAFGDVGAAPVARHLRPGGAWMQLRVPAWEPPAHGFLS